MDSPTSHTSEETRGTPDMYLQFGHESQAHYRVPVGDRDVFVTLARPKELTRANHYAFDSILSDLRNKLASVLSTMTEYADQPHVEARMNVFQPGNYLKLQKEETSDPTNEASPNAYLVTLSYGNHRHALVFHSTRKDMQTTRRAVNRLLESILKIGSAQ